jgi:protein transport protein SEC61 subunit gamma-like protein
MAFLDRAKHAQETFDGRLRNFGHGKYGRILRMARKPSVEDYVKVLSVTALGAVIIGTTGFVLYIFFQVWGPYLWGNFLGPLFP